MGFVLPQLQFFVGCLDGGKILLDRSGWPIDIEGTLEEKDGRLKRRSELPSIIGYSLREEFCGRGQLAAQQPCIALPEGITS